MGSLVSQETAKQTYIDNENKLIRELTEAHSKAMAPDPYIKCLKMVISRSDEPIGVSNESGSNRVILR